MFEPEPRAGLRACAGPAEEEDVDGAEDLPDHRWPVGHPVRRRLRRLQRPGRQGGERTFSKDQEAKAGHVVLKTCEIDSADSDLLPNVKFDLEVNNSSENQNTYFIDVFVYDAKGTRVGNTSSIVSDVRPGQKAVERGSILLSQKVTGKITCKVDKEFYDTAAPDGANHAGRARARAGALGGGDAQTGRAPMSTDSSPVQEHCREVRVYHPRAAVRADARPSERPPAGCWGPLAISATRCRGGPQCAEASGRAPVRCPPQVRTKTGVFSSSGTSIGSARGSPAGRSPG